LAFIKIKSRGSEKYYYYVESYRVDDKVYQKTLKYIGKEEPDKNFLKELKLEFTDKKIQKLIRSDLDFKKYKLDDEFLKRAENIKKIFFENLSKLGEVSKRQLERRFKTGFTYHSCSIEGNTLSRAQVDLVINRDISVEGKRLLEIEELRNHKKAIDYMISEQSDLNEDFIKRLHEVLMRNIDEFFEDDIYFIKTGYRCDMRYIEGADFVPVNPILIADEMKKLLSFYRKNKYKIHPLELASEFHLRFAIIHPFSDGNGRMARLLMNFILDRSGFPMIDITLKNREKYIGALASGDSKNLSEFILNELEDYVKQLFQ
jgi:fido (protein-threonine AMPylation protein)